MDSEFARAIGGVAGAALVLGAAVSSFTGWHFGLVCAALTLAGWAYAVPKELQRIRREAALDAAPKRVEQCGDLTVEFANVNGHTTWRYVNLVGTPHSLAHTIAMKAGPRRGAVTRRTCRWLQETSNGRSSHDDQASEGTADRAHDCRPALTRGRLLSR